MGSPFAQVARSPHPTPAKNTGRRRHGTIAQTPAKASSVQLVALVVVDWVELCQQPVLDQELEEMVQHGPVLFAAHPKLRLEKPANQAALA